ncbi:hypothetical protein BT96DRAFT_892388 [Gymnopus androsaceus JB14]|uniref:Nephrocystin 3-like N-terminal domain-containing protein n=1 Tax=Gymnopus androsaceus JB14 TaxID=1447944 RepID=A0A6A4GGP5_9AGAR|nr:hypothetical protein BT96DRAFT_892388 [Gymnopus androsaceus JB14]
MVQEFEGKVQGAYEQCKMKILFAVDRNTAEILKEIVLGQLIHSPQAYYDADIGVEFARRLCSLNTREKILTDIETWATTSNPDDALGYWMCGMAGTGKSTIAMSICKALEEKDLLAGTFFCSRQIPECRDYRLIIPTLAYQLARFSNTFAMSLRDILSVNPDLPSKYPECSSQRTLN